MPEHDSYDPTDHARTTLPRAGEAMKDRRSLGAYATLGFAVLAVAVCLGAAARGMMDWAIAAGVIALLAAMVGSLWVYAERRHIARVAQRNSRDPEPPGVTSGRRRN